MKTIVFMYRNMDLGGCQLLIDKLSRELRHTNRVMIICEKICEELLLSLKENDVELHLLSNGKWESDKEMSALIGKLAQDAKFVTFLWLDFLRINAITLISQRVLFYGVHYNAISSIIDSKYAICRLLRKAVLRKDVRRLIDTYNIVAMDEQTFSHAERAFGDNYNNGRIIRIPVDFFSDGLDILELRKRFASKNKSILAIARADFPFKGYILGLMRLIEKKSIPEDYELVIVSYGSDFGEIAKLYDELDESCKKRIKIIGKTEYSQLKAIFSRAQIFVGMGTSLIDAAQNGLLAIPVEAYTYKVKCDDFFDTRPELLALDKGNEKKFLELLNAIDSLSVNDIEMRLIHCYDEIYNMYNTREVAKKIDITLEHIGNAKYVLLVMEYYIRKAIAIIRKTKRVVVG